MLIEVSHIKLAACGVIAAGLVVIVVGMYMAFDGVVATVTAGIVLVIVGAAGFSEG